MLSTAETHQRWSRALLNTSECQRSIKNIRHTDTARWISEHGEGLFHICLEVEDIKDALDELKRKGVKLIDEQPRIGHANSRIAFIDPKSTGNVLIELVELSNPS